MGAFGSYWNWIDEYNDKIKNIEWNGKIDYSEWNY